MSHHDKLARVFKADAATSDLSSGGLLLDDIRDEFIEQPLKKSKLLGEVRAEDMDSFDKRIPKLIPPAQVAHPGVEGVALPVSDRSKATMGQVLLQTNEIISEQRFTWGFLEDSIKRGQLKSVIMTYLGKVFRNDVEKLGIQGDTASANDLLAKQDGWLKRFTSNVVAHGSAVPSKAMFSTAVREMDEEWIGDPGEMRHYIGPHAKMRYAEQVADRQTSLGDSYFVGQATVTGAGIPIVGADLFPNADGGSSNETTCLTTRPGNMLVGFWKEVSVKLGQSLSPRVDIALTRTRVGFNIEWNDGATKTTGILGRN